MNQRGNDEEAQGHEGGHSMNTIFDPTEWFPVYQNKNDQTARNQRTHIHFLKTSINPYNNSNVVDRSAVT